jgi:hypothetical protein
VLPFKKKFFLNHAVSPSPPPSKKKNLHEVFSSPLAIYCTIFPQKFRAGLLPQPVKKALATVAVGFIFMFVAACRPLAWYLVIYTVFLKRMISIGYQLR